MTVTVLAGSRAPIGDTTTVQRLLPRRQRSTVGPWCFVDLMGPDDLDGGRGMSVPPHPHVGLQTVTWLVEGKALHRDSLGSEQVIEPGQLNLMTAGRGIAHSEHSTDDAPPRLHGLQLWVALPAAAEAVEPAFEHHRELPTGDGFRVLMGRHAGMASPATTYSECLAVELVLGAGEREVMLDPGYEHAVVGIDGELVVGETPVAAGSLAVIDAGATRVALRGRHGSRVMLLGGAPRAEPLVMWWNFVGSSTGLVERARADWESGETFGQVPGGERRIPAPPLPPGRLKPRGQPQVVSYP